MDDAVGIKEQAGGTAEEQAGPEVQRRLVEGALRRGALDEWYLVDYAWWTQWQGWVSGARLVREARTPPRPGAIDNRTLLWSERALQSGLVWRQHYEAVPREAWQLLVGWFGGGPPIAGERAQNKRARVEDPRNGPSRLACGACFERVEIDRAVGCGRCGAVAYCGRDCQRSHWRFHRPYCEELREAARGVDAKTPRDDGVESELGRRARLDLAAAPWWNERSGLENCGNTCFLNATVQSLRRARPLTQYFLSDAYRRDVNEANPLGTGGRLAREYAATVKRLEVGRERSIAPTALIRAIVRKNPDLGGRAQHDAHELLETLLDGIHEDLNRRSLVPAVATETPESTDYADDARVAQETWTNHARRNASAVAASTHGLLRSTLECPECETRRARFDPFSTLELELAEPDADDADDPAALSDDDDDDDWTLDDTPDDARPLRLRPRSMLVAADSGCAAADALVALRTAAAAALKTLPERVFVYDLAHSPARANGDPPRFAAPRCLQTDLPDVYVDENDDARRDENDEPRRVLVACVAPPRDCRLGIVRHILATGVSDLVSIATLAVNWPTDRARLSAWRAAKKVVDIESLDPADANPPDPKKAVVVEFKQATSRRRRPPVSAATPRRRPRANVYGEPDADDDDDDADDDDGCGDDLASLYVADWPATSTALGRTIAVKVSRRDVLELAGMDAARFAATAATAVESAAEVARQRRRRTRRAIARAQHESQEAARRLRHYAPGTVYAPRRLHGFGAPVTLEGCLRRFTAIERLDADNSWFCSTCARRRRARKRIALWRTPDILIFTLKRFSPLHGRKLDRPVDFPLEGLDLGPFCAHVRGENRSLTYTLFAVINHFGTAGYGHYTAFTRDLWAYPGLDGWYRCDDAVVA
ncbi:hypothetical protein CTAYLR_004359 [Chrysophaeum taylorii]|uniref:Ubiquitin carboxyl-terminal hydrolase n=1 Tax=Chrysophaeum taylorii TaxID=2483200 RepID=A0AAD7XQX4_9STRA|nr:hypothetical protein CTAYLR_004359 [Chrysophaeum taylorii]